MNRIKGFLVCVVLLLTAGILHHEWSRMTGQSLLATPAHAAILQNGSGQQCNGTGLWHFVNNQTGGACGTIDVEFTCNGQITPFDNVPATKCLSSTDHYNVTTNGACTLFSASTGNQPGNLVLSNYSCTVAPTPTPTPSPTPTP